MRAEELLKELDEQYPDSMDDVEDEKQFFERKIQRELINHIRLLVTPKPTKDK